MSKRYKTSFWSMNKKEEPASSYTSSPSSYLTPRTSQKKLVVQFLAMASRCPFTAISIPGKKTSNSAAKFRVSFLRNPHLQLEIAPINGKNLTSRNKVFEDSENGVICYRDEKGELICEGYDEGPRFSVGIKKQRLANRLSDK